MSSTVKSGAKNPGCQDLKRLEVPKEDTEISGVGVLPGHFLQVPEALTGLEVDRTVRDHTQNPQGMDNIANQDNVKGH